MASIIAERMTARLEGDFVVFLIGMRINKPWKVHRWWPVFVAMPRMLRELEAEGPESGFLGHTGIGLRSITQYWRSFDHLEAYARRANGLHLGAWAAFNRAARDARDDVGIWHETYRIRAGEYESVYSGMPPFGLGRIGGHVDPDRSDSDLGADLVLAADVGVATRVVAHEHRRKPRGDPPLAQACHARREVCLHRGRGGLAVQGDRRHGAKPSDPVTVPPVGPRTTGCPPPPRRPPVTHLRRG